MRCYSMTIEKSARSVREIKRICKISFALHNHFCVVGYKHKSPNVDHNYFFQNNYTILPNEFCNCPCDVPRRLFEMAKSQLADILANLEQQMETNQSDTLCFRMRRLFVLGTSKCGDFVL